MQHFSVMHTLFLIQIIPENGQTHSNKFTLNTLETHSEIIQAGVNQY